MVQKQEENERAKAEVILQRLDEKEKRLNGVPVMRDTLSSETRRVEFAYLQIVNSYYSIILRSKNV